MDFNSQEVREGIPVRENSLKDRKYECSETTFVTLKWNILSIDSVSLAWGYLKIGHCCKTTVIKPLNHGIIIS